MLQVKDISIRYDDRSVLERVSFELPEGRVIALLGANGAGKTSLLRALNGVISIASGDIELNQRSIFFELSRREIARNIAVVAQENETRFPITVLEFVLAGRFANGTSLGWESTDDREAALSAIADCELSDFEHRQMNHLSGGERQRVVLARALASGARILLLDEPTANLDLANQAHMFHLVRERCRRGWSAIIITHDLNLAAEFADEIIMLKDGSMAAKGAAADVLTAENIGCVFAVNVLLDSHPVSGNVRVTSVF